MYNVGDKVKVINSEGIRARNDKWELVPVLYDGFVTEVTLVEDDGVVWIVGTDGASVWIDAHRVEATC